MPYENSLQTLLGDMSRFLQAVLALIPLLLTPAVFYLLAEGMLDFGGGEKDIILTLPWLIWSVVFAFSAFVFIYRRWVPTKWIVGSVVIATTVLIGLGIIAYTASFLGIG